MRSLVDSHLHLWERDKHAQPWIDASSMAAIDRDFPPAAVASRSTVSERSLTHWTATHPSTLCTASSVTAASGGKSRSMAAIDSASIQG